MRNLRTDLLLLAVAFLLSIVLGILPVGSVSAHANAEPQKVHVSYHYQYNAFVLWCFSLPGVKRSQYGGYEITDGGNITGNATDDAYFWGYNLVYPGGLYGTITEYGWDANGNPLPYHIEGEYHNITCGVNA